MKIVHVSDTHLGHVGQGIQRQVEDPFHPGARISQRAADIVEAFRRAIDIIVDELQPALVIHSGDLFDSARPPNSVLDVAMHELRRLTEHGIELLVIEGHHSYPRERAMGHPLRLLEYLPGLRAVYEDYADVRFGTLPLVVHALPHGSLNGGALPNRECIDPDVANVLVTHGVADEVPFFRMNRPAPPIFLRECGDWYDYVALGHFHRFAQPNLRRRSFYAGAPTMITWHDFAAGHRFSINEVELVPGADPVVRPVVVPGRAMHAYGLDYARELSARDIVGYLERQVEHSPPTDAYCLVHVAEIDPSARKELDLRLVESLFGGAAGLRLEISNRDLPFAETLQAQREGGSPENRFRTIATLYEPAIRDEVLSLGLGFLERAAAAATEGDEG